MNGPYKIRRFANGGLNGKKYTNYSLTVPGVVADKLPNNITFECVLTNEGILYRPCKDEDDVVELPDWAKNDE